MNIIEKAFCRLYQLSFRLVLPLLPYRSPEILDDVTKVAGLIKKLGADSCLLVTGQSARKRGRTARLEAALEAAGIRLAVYDKTVENPTVNNVEEARKVYVDNGCKCIIAFGGGSPIDCAKAVGARIAHPNKSLKQLKGLLKVWKRLPPLIAIPTTAGSGSETTLAAVVTERESKYKYTILSFPLIPHYAVLDAELTYSLPPSLTASIGMDALTHAVEAYIGRSTTKETRRLALEATSLILSNIEAAYLNGTDNTARKNMLLASHKAGVAFSKSYVGYVHGIAHSLGGKYNIAHGLANAVLLPIVLEEYGKHVYKKLYELAVYAGVANEDDSHSQAAEKFIATLRTLNGKMGIPEAISEIREDDITEMAYHAAKESNPLYPVPVLMNAKELKSIYYKAALKANFKKGS